MIYGSRLSLDVADAGVATCTSFSSAARLTCSSLAISNIQPFPWHLDAVWRSAGSQAPDMCKHSPLVGEMLWNLFWGYKYQAHTLWMSSRSRRAGMFLGLALYFPSVLLFHNAALVKSGFRSLLANFTHSHWHSCVAQVYISTSWLLLIYTTI